MPGSHPHPRKPGAAVRYLPTQHSAAVGVDDLVPNSPQSHSDFLERENVRVLRPATAGGGGVPHPATPQSLEAWDTSPLLCS